MDKTDEQSVKPYDPLACRVCKKPFKKKSHTQEHELTHDKNRPSILCPVDGCNNSYAKKNGWTKHFRKHHSELSLDVYEKLLVSINFFYFMLEIIFSHFDSLPKDTANTSLDEASRSEPNNESNELQDLPNDKEVQSSSTSLTITSCNESSN